MQRKFPTLIGLIIILVFAVIAFGGVFVWQNFTVKSQSPMPNAQQNSNDKNNEILNREFPLADQEAPVQTAGWKTYTNTEYGFEFQYPQNWSTTQPDKNYFCFGENGKIYNLNKYYPGCGITLSVLDFEKDCKGFEGQDVCVSAKLLETRLNQTSQPYQELTSLAGVKLISQDYSADPKNYPLNSPLCKIASTDKGAKTFTFGVCKTDELDNVYNQILSTFKFTK